MLTPPKWEKVTTIGNKMINYMKKTIRTILYAVVFAVLAVSCQKEINGVEPETNTKETIEISINGLMGEYTQVDATKSELVNTVRVSWKAGDVVYVYDGTQCLGSLIASLDGTEDRYALLSTDDTHTVSAPASGTKLTLVHSPLLTEAPAVSEGAISISLASQSGEKAPFVAYATLEYTGTTITNAVVPFKFATSVIKVNCTGLKPGTAITSATLSNVNTECKLTLSGTAAPSVSGDINGTITRTGDSYFATGKINAEGEAVFQIAVPALEAASGARILTVAQGSDEVKDKNFSKKAIDPATSVNTVCQLVGLPAGALPGVFTVSDNGGKTKQIYFSQGNLYCSGVKFYTDKAADNYGTVKSMDNAQWGFEANQYDTTPTSDGDLDATHVSHFYWSQSVKSAIEGYNWDGSGSDVFFTNVDGFKVNVGGTEQTGWRTLSKMEWQYLFNTRTMTNGKDRYTLNITYGGKIGLVLYPDDYDNDPISGSVKTMPEGVVFLPAAGYRFGSNVYHVGDGGYYWSSAARGEDGAYCVSFDSDNVAPGDGDDRCYGYSVRLITDVK